jgi:hypothetical protein
VLIETSILFVGYSFELEDLLQEASAAGPAGRELTIWVREQLQDKCFLAALLEAASEHYDAKDFPRDPTDVIGEEELNSLAAGLRVLYQAELQALTPLEPPGPRQRLSALADRTRA